MREWEWNEIERDTTTGERRWLVSEGDDVSSRVSRIRKIEGGHRTVTPVVEFCLEVMELARRIATADDAKEIVSLMDELTALVKAYRPD